MEQILHQLRLVVYPIIYKVLYIPGGAGFLPSTVSTGEPFFFYTSAVAHRNPDQLDGLANSSWEKHTINCCLYLKRNHHSKETMTLLKKQTDLKNRWIQKKSQESYGLKP